VFTPTLSCVPLAKDQTALRDETTGDVTAQGDEERLAPLVDRLIAEVTELQGRWEALGEELEAKRRRLGLAEATMELLQRRQEEAASEEGGGGVAGGGVGRAEDNEGHSQAAQASLGYQMRPPCGDCDLDIIVFGQAPAGSSVVGKRPHPLGPDYHRGKGPLLNLVTSLPLSVWREHLRPVLPVKEVVRLRRVCKALKAMVTEWPMNLKHAWPSRLEPALRCFPATVSLTIVELEPLAPAEESRMVELLRGHGGTLKDVNAQGGGAERLLLSAVRAGALPKLTFFYFPLANPIHREILAGGTLGCLEQVTLSIKQAEHFAALEHLRRLPHLHTIYLKCNGVQETTLPPFIPPTLKSLLLEVQPYANLESLLRQLPHVLRASGASLEEIGVDTYDETAVEFGAALAQVLRACSPTLKRLKLLCRWRYILSTACVAGLLPGLTSCCDTLEVLSCPWAVFSALPATCPTFPRLTKLHVPAGRDEEVDLASPGWEVMANGRLPALASIVIGNVGKFRSSCHEPGGASEGAGRLARAFEAVAGTLNRLILSGQIIPGGRGDDLPAGACYELGAAIGKLRRLRYLKLDLFTDGRAYYAVGRGLAASEGSPKLATLKLLQLQINLDWVTYEPSLIVPSVRDLVIHGRCTEEEALLLCCGLVQAGYRSRICNDLHSSDDRPSRFPSSVSACMRAIEGAGGIERRTYYMYG
jgi:hypothetical protein